MSSEPTTAMFPPMQQIVPEGEIGDARIEHRWATPTHVELYEARVAMSPRRYDPARDRLEVGPYAALYVDETLVMSDSLMEKITNQEFVERARGHVLVAGLGLGMILHPVLAKPEVWDVVVLEQSPGVIELVADTLQHHIDNKQLQIVQADAFTWRPPRRYHFDTIYFDIWPTVSGAYAQEISALKRRYRSRLRPGGWMGAWREADMRRHRRQQLSRGAHATKR